MKNFLKSDFQTLDRRAGVSIILVLVLITVLSFMMLVSVNTTMTYSATADARELQFRSRQIAESAMAQAMARIKEGGYLAPYSAPASGGSSAQWITFGGGQFLYYTQYDASTELSLVRAWGKIRAEGTASSSTVAPDDLAWDGTGWVVSGFEVAVKGNVYVPETPMFFGNGGIEKPAGGFDWTGGSDLSDPSTWGVVPSGSHSSYQASSIPFEVSSLDHPYDYMTAGGTPTPASTNPHPYKLWASQNTIGQFNVEAWFRNSAGSGYDPTTSVSPPPSASNFDITDSNSPDYPYPVDASVPDVQSFAWELYNTFGASGNQLSSGSQSGTYGNLSDPQVTFATGTLRVDAGDTFEGTGVLVIRDDYDPNVDTDNRPGTSAALDIRGNFKWTGLVIIAGWRPSVSVSSGGDAQVVGALFGEDSVQSGGEVSLDSATIIMKINGPMKVLYSNALFRSGGLIHHLLPRVSKEIVGVRHL